MLYDGDSQNKKSLTFNLLCHVKNIMYDTSSEFKRRWMGRKRKTQENINKLYVKNKEFVIPTNRLKPGGYKKTGISRQPFCMLKSS